MGFPAPSKLFFAAAALFLGVVVIGIASNGFEPKAIIGMTIAGALVRLGWKARGPC